MYYIYILYSAVHDKYYVGQTNDLERRLLEHNESPRNSYTSKYRPWKMIRSFEIGESLGLARKVENHIKRQKSKAFLEDLIKKDSIEYLKDRFGREG